MFVSILMVMGKGRIAVTTSPDLPCRDSVAGSLLRKAHYAAFEMDLEISADKDKEGD